MLRVKQRKRIVPSKYLKNSWVPHHEYLPTRRDFLLRGGAGYNTCKRRFS